MILKKYLTNLTQAANTIGALGVTVCVLAVSNLALVAHALDKKERIVVVPPGLSGPVAVDWGKADVEYMKAFGVFYSTMLGTITPRNVAYVADRLSAMTAPNTFAPIRKQLLSLAKDDAFARSNAVTNFVSHQVIHEDGVIFVVGESVTYTGVGKPDTKPMVYEMDIRIAEGRPVVSRVTNYPGSKPHTKEWKAANPNWQKENQE